MAGNPLYAIPGLGGYVAQSEANQAQSANNLQQAAQFLTLQQAMENAQRQQQYRGAIAGLGENPSQDSLAQVAAKYASPADVLKIQQQSIDRKAQIEAQREAKVLSLAQMAQNAEAIHEFRMGRLQSDTDRAAETARHNKAMEGIQTQLNDLRGQSKVPAGYRATPEGNLEAIPGGPADLKIQGQFNQDTAAFNSLNSDLDRLAAEANRLKEHPGLSKATGFMSVVPGVGGLATVPGTDAANFKSGMDTLKSQVAFGVLQNLRNNSKTGGALGQVSDKEGQLLQSNLAALSSAQSPDQFKAALDRIIKYTEEAKDRLRTAYNMKSGTAARATAQGAPAPSKQRIRFDAQGNVIP